MDMAYGCAEEWSLRSTVSSPFLPSRKFGLKDTPKPLGSQSGSESRAMKFRQWSGHVAGKENNQVDSKGRTKKNEDTIAFP